MQKYDWKNNFTITNTSQEIYIYEHLNGGLLLQATSKYINGWKFVKRDVSQVCIVLRKTKLSKIICCYNLTKKKLRYTALVQSKHLGKFQRTFEKSCYHKKLLKFADLGPF